MALTSRPIDLDSIYVARAVASLERAGLAAFYRGAPTYALMVATGREALSGARPGAAPATAPYYSETRRRVVAALAADLIALEERATGRGRERFLVDLETGLDVSTIC